VKNFVQSDEVMDVTLTAVVASGGVMDLGKIVGVAAEAGVTGDVVAVATRGVFSVASATGPFTQGRRVFLNASGLATQIDTGALQPMGIVWEAGATGPLTNLKVGINFGGVNAPTGPTGSDGP
jgi:predicted RecA/RadA family phage recombinase